MADNSPIEWTDATWNPVTGCTIVDAGCTNCYAMDLAGTRLRNHPSRSGLTRITGGRPKWTGEVRLNEQWLDQPLRWSRPRRIFVCAHGDLFHEAVPDEWIDQVFAVMALCPQHTFQVLTKRPERAAQYLSGNPDSLRDRWFRAVPAGRWYVSVAEAYAGIHPHCSDETRALYHRAAPAYPLPNVWLGTSASDQASADLRIPDLLACPAAVRFVSLEPLLGPVDLTEIAVSRPDLRASVILDALRGTGGFDGPPGRLDLVIVGGESGRNARPMHPDWARSLRDQCVAAGVPFFFKQWGEWELSLDRDLDDPDWRADYSRNYVDHGRSRWINLEGGCGFHGERFCVMRNVGKKVAGRLLDGRTWDQMPGGAA